MNTTVTMAPCNHCNGTGGTDHPCTACHGRGERPAATDCEACGERRATRDGLCDVCDADVNTYLGAMEGARFYFGDDEGELRVKGHRC